MARTGTSVTRWTSYVPTAGRQTAPEPRPIPVRRRGARVGPRHDATRLAHRHLSQEHRDALDLVASGVDASGVSAGPAVDAVAGAVAREDPV
jgi:hypothetical protein